MENIPFVDLNAQFDQIKTELKKGIDDVIESKAFIGGKYQTLFEKSFCEVHGGDHAVGCSNGTSAITLALRALGVGAGDEVITVANTFFATAEAIAEVGAKIVLIDMDEKTYGMDLSQLEMVITKNTKAIIPVHLYGNPVNMEMIMDLAKRHKLFVIEDSAQAHMAQYKGKSVGTYGDAGTFSFYPGKNLGAYGDAGLVLAKDEVLQKKIRMYANHGRISKYDHEFLAGNYRMDGIQASVLTTKLKYIDQWTEQRRENAKSYDELLKPKGFKVIETDVDAKAVYHLYIVEVSNRDEVMEHLKSHNISCGIHYPIPLHLLKALEHLNYKSGDFPKSEKASKRILSLPMYPELTKTQVERVVNEFLKVAKS